jgi:hypothetical protein
VGIDADGATEEERAVKHGRRLVAVLTMLASAGCAGTTVMAPPTVNVTGKWLGTWMFDPVSLGGGQVVMDLNQVGAAVTGNLLVTGPSVNRPTTIEAVVSGDKVILKGRIPGTLTVTGDQMSGTADGVVPAIISAQRQK